MFFSNFLELLPDAQLERVHKASLKILAETGVVFHCPEAVELFRQHGAKVENKTVFITEKMVDRALETCPSQFQWTARNRKHDVIVGKGFMAQPAVGPVYIKDLDNGRRKALLTDYANIMKLCQASPVVHLNGSLPVDPSDVPSDKKHLYMMMEILKNTDKPVIGFCLDGGQVRRDLEMMDMAMRHRGGIDQNHCIGVLVNPLSPLGFSRETTETIMEYARRNQIILMAPCIMAGVSGPIRLLGVSVLQNAENLAGIVLAQLTNPGTPVVYATASNVGYLKLGSFAAGSPEAMLVNMPDIQLARRFYNLPTRTMCGITHAKEVNCQAGYESMMSLMMGVLSGANIGVQCIGTLEALMTVSYEKIIIDQEMISRALRFQRGVEVSEDSLSVDVIEEVGPGGSYLIHPSTFEHCRTLWNPTVSDWESFETWEAKGAEDPVVKANRIYKEILANAPETFLDPELDRDLQTYIQRDLSAAA